MIERPYYLEVVDLPEGWRWAVDGDGWWCAESEDGSKRVFENADPPDGRLRLASTGDHWTYTAPTEVFVAVRRANSMLKDPGSVACSRRQLVQLVQSLLWWADDLLMLESEDKDRLEKILDRSPIWWPFRSQANPVGSMDKYKQHHRRWMMARLLGITMSQEAEYAEAADDIWRTMSTVEHEELEKWLEGEMVVARAETLRKKSANAD